MPGPIPGPPTATVSGKSVVSLAWSKPCYSGGAPVVSYKVEAWLLGEGAMWTEVRPVSFASLHSSSRRLRCVRESEFRNDSLTESSLMVGRFSFSLQSCRRICRVFTSLFTLRQVAVTPITSTDIYSLKPEREYLFRITPRNKYGWGESLVSSTAVRTTTKTGLPCFVRQLPAQIRALEHSDVELECQVTGEPAPGVEWYRDGAKLDPARQPRYEVRSVRSSSRHALTVRDVRSDGDDEAKFTCEAANAVGRVATFTRVLVVDDPSVAEADAYFRR